MVNFSFERQVDTQTSRIPSVEALFLRGLTSRTDGLTVRRLRVPRTLRAIWPSLHRMCCSTWNSPNRAHRWCMAASFPLLSDEHRTTTLRTLRTCWNKIGPRTSCALRRVHVFVRFCAARFSLYGAVLAQLGREFVQVLLRFLFKVGECF